MDLISFCEKVPSRDRKRSRWDIECPSDTCDHWGSKRTRRLPQGTSIQNQGTMHYFIWRKAFTGTLILVPVGTARPHGYRLFMNPMDSCPKSTTIIPLTTLHSYVNVTCSGLYSDAKLEYLHMYVHVLPCDSLKDGDDGSQKCNKGSMKRHVVVS